MKLVIKVDSLASEIKEAFSEHFKNLKLEFFNKSHGAREGSAKKDMVENDVKLSKLNPSIADGNISITTSMKVSEIEADFENNFGLHVQIFRQMDQLWIETTRTDHYTLKMQIELSEDSKKRYSIMNVLIPTDFSDNAKHAINYVQNHFQVEKLKIKLIHSVQEPHSSSGVLIPLDELMKKDAEKEMEKLANRISEVYGYKPEYYIKYGHLKDWVSKYAEYDNIDLIVMGTKGESNISSKIMGSVTESLIRTSKIPIFAIPEQLNDKSVHQIVFATDKKELRNQDFIEKFINSLKLNLPKINILTVIKGRKDGSIPKSIPLKGYQFGVKTVENDSVVDGINEFITSNDVDILGMFHAHNSRLDYLFHRSITRTICGKCKVPLLVLPAHG